MNTRRKHIYLSSAGYAAAVGVCMALALTTPTADAREQVELVNEDYTPIVETIDDYEFPTPPYIAAGYPSVQEYWSDLKTMRSDAYMVSDDAIKLYSDVITEEQTKELITLENKMTNASSIAKYNESLEAFNAITTECDAALADYLASQAVYVSSSNSSSSGSSGGYSSDPFNFRSAGVLYDSQYRYTYYSSNVLYHYRTSEWTAGSDGIYRDSAGRVVVASDDYPQGTVVYSDLFGECIVYDCGVGSSGTLDVYTNF